jgi:hypothetical protein
MCVRVSSMGYDEIKAHLEHVLREAAALHSREQRAETAHAERIAQERYERFVFDGMIPEDLPEGLD